MKRMRVLALVLTLFSLTLWGCAPMTSVPMLTSLPMVSNLTGALGITAEQAIGGAGSLLGLAKEKLPKADWKKVAAAVPGADMLMTEGAKLGGFKLGKMGDLSKMAEGFSKMGLSSDQVTKMVPTIGDYMAKTGGAEAASLFKSAIQ